MKVGRNDPCPCGSGKKYKHCCYTKDSVKQELPDEPEQAAEASEADADPAAEGDAHKKQTTRQKDRTRFQGDNRGRNTGFRPKATRGGQRGS